MEVLTQKPKKAEERKVGPTPSKPSSIGDKAKLNELENNIKSKNKQILSMQKEIDDLKAASKSQGSPSKADAKQLQRLEKENISLNRMLKQAEDKYSHDKKKMEEILRESLITPQTGDFLLLQKKIEMLERDLIDKEEESKRASFQNTYSSKDRQELKNLKAQIESERAYYSQIIEKKNHEISMFRDELDLMLKELEELKQQNYEKELIFMQKQNRDMPANSKLY